MKKKILISVSGCLLLFLAVLFLGGCGSKNSNPAENDKANDSDRSQQRKRNQQNMPAEMMSACQNKAEGDGCEMTMPGNPNSSAKIMGTCAKSPQGDQLACRPSQALDGTAKQPAENSAGQSQK